MPPQPAVCRPDGAWPAHQRLGHTLGLVVVLLVAVVILRLDAETAGLAIMGVENETRPVDLGSVVLHDLIGDPIEPFNRGSFVVTKGAVDYAVKPLAHGWCFLVPRPGRDAVDRVSRNVAYPVRLVSLLLQGRLGESCQETGHFVVNSTVGVAGLFDPAGHLGIPTYPEDVGQAFGAWGMGHGFYLFLPLLGPGSGRDATGRIVDTAISPSSYVPGLNWFFAFNGLSLRLDVYEGLVASRRELYSVSRALWAIKRRAEVTDYVIPESAFTTANADPSLGVLLLGPRSVSFLSRSTEASVRLATTDRRLPYSAWLQKRPAPLVLLVPGIGAHRQGSTSLALAEMLFGQGYSVATISNVFHAEFMLAALSHPYPGYTPGDAHDVLTALTAVRADLERRRPGRITDVCLAGYSLGGILALFGATSDAGTSEAGPPFTRVVAINPPVDLFEAALEFDRFFEVPRQWPAPTRRQHLEDVALRAYALVAQGLPEGRPLPFTWEESRFLVGLSGRDVLATALRVDGLRRRQASTARPGVSADALRAMSAVSFGQYIDTRLLPNWLARWPSASAEQLRRQASLRAIGARLAGDPRIRVVTNADDFVLGAEGARWLRDTLGERVTVFPTGGHLGNLQAPEVRQAILTACGGSRRPAPAAEP